MYGYQGPEEDRLLGKNSDENSTSLACQAVTWPIDRCLASATGNPNITIKLIADFILEIYEFITTSVDFTSIKEFFTVVEQSVDPKVVTSKLTCSCERPANNASQVPWNCNATLSNPRASYTCDCLNSNEDNAFCDISVDCPPLTPIAYGGRCNNEYEYASGQFHFDDIGFGIPGRVPLPKQTRCNAEISRNTAEPFLLVEAFAYCKKV